MTPKKHRTQTELLAALAPSPYYLDPERVHRDPFGNIWIRSDPGVSSGEQWFHVDGAGLRFVNLGRSQLYKHVTFDRSGRPTGQLACPDPERCPHIAGLP
jgi:hypothetical protein